MKSLTPLEFASREEVLASLKQTYSPSTWEVNKAFAKEALHHTLFGAAATDAAFGNVRQQVDPFAEIAAQGGWTPPHQTDLVVQAYQESHPELLEAIEEEEFEGRGYASLGLRYDPNLSRGEWQLVAKRTAQKQHNDFVVSRASTGQKVVGFGVAIATGFIDPINYLPFAGAAGAAAKAIRLAQFLPKGIKVMNPTLRAALVGAADASLGEAVITPALMAQAATFQEDYSLGDAMVNVGLAVGTGGILGGLGGVLRGRSTQQHLDATQLATAQLSRGEPVDLHALLPTQIHGDAVLRAGMRGEDIPPEVLTKLRLAAKVEEITPQQIENVLAHKLEGTGLSSAAEAKLARHLHLSDDAHAAASAFRLGAEPSDPLVQAFVSKKMTPWWGGRAKGLAKRLKELDAQIATLASHKKPVPNALLVSRAQVGQRLEDATVRMQEADVEADFENPAKTLRPEEMRTGFAQGSAQGRDQAGGLGDEQAAEVLAVLSDLETRGQTLTEEGLDALAQHADAPAGMKAFVQLRKASAQNAARGMEEMMAGFKDRAKGLEAFLVGSEAGVGGQHSLENSMRSARGHVLGELAAEMEKINPKAMRRLRDKQFNHDLAVAMWERGRGLEPRVKNAEVEAFAQLFERYKETLLNQLRAQGVPIGKLDGHVFSQSHSRLKLIKAGREQWMRHIAPLLDHTRTFVSKTTGEALDDAGRLKFLKAAYTHIINQDSVSAASSGGTGLMERLTASRVLHFKSPEAMLAYNTTFGHASPAESMVQNLANRAEEVALVERMGPDPDAMFKQALKEVQKEHADRGTLFKNEAKLKLFYKASAQADDIADPRIASFFSGLRTVVNMAKLGKLLLSSIVDTATTAHVLQRNGAGLMQQFEGVFNFLPKGREGRRIAQQLGVGVDGMLASMMKRYNPVDTVQGKMATAQKWFFFANGGTWWNSAMQQGAGLMLSNNLARQLANPWAKAPKALRRRLGQHGMGEKDWAALQAGLIKDDAGREFITADSLEVAGFGGDLSNKLAGYFINEVDAAVITPGARTKYYTSTRFARGEVLAEIMRSLFQFKSFSIALVQRIWAPIAADFKAAETAGEKLGVVYSATKFAVMSSAMGYLSLSLKDLSAGRVPQPLWSEKEGVNPDALSRAVLAGGGMGVMGDVLVAGVSQEGTSLSGLSHWMSGPGLGVLEDAVQLGKAGYQAAFKNNPQRDLGAKTLRVIERNIPGGNLFYAHTALRLLFWGQLQEFASPGYTQRQQQRAEKQGREYWLKPTDYIQHGTAWGLR